MREEKHPFPSEVSSLANQHELGEFRQCHTTGGRLFWSVFGGVFVLSGLMISISTTQAKPAGPVCALVGMLFGLSGFFNPAYSTPTYEYEGGLIVFNTRKQKVTYSLRWSEIKSTEVLVHRGGGSYYAINTRDERFPLQDQSVWKRCHEAAARNYERNQVMTPNADEGIYAIYAGSIRVKPKRFSTTPERIETIAVHRQVYEEELAQKGHEVELSTYWLPRYNGATVYFRGRTDPSVISWILEGTQVGGDVPPDAFPTLEQMRTCLSELFSVPGEKRSLDLASFDEEVVRQRVLTIAQRQHMRGNNRDVNRVLDLADVVNKQLQRKGRKNPI